jgi:GNAT superfamily N-acetyltransferase
VTVVGGLEFRRGQVLDSRQNGQMSATAFVELSEHPEWIEATRSLLQEYLCLPDAWERFGGVPVRLPKILAREVSMFPGPAAPPEGDAILAINANELIAAGHIVALMDDVCEFKRVYVRPTHQRRHVATRLGEAMIERARNLGHQRIVLDVAPERPAAVQLWTSLGFRPCEPYRTYPFAMEFMERELATPT